MIIDVHVHLFPPKMFQAVWRFFEDHDWAVHHEHVAQIEKTLREHGVSGAVGLSYPHKIGVAGPLNQFMESVGKEFPFFYPFASVHPDDEDFEAIVDHAVESPYIYGFKFQPLVQAFDINLPRLDYLYERCQALQIPVTMHMGTAPYANEFVGPGHFAKMIRRFPELRACVPHMGANESDEFLHMMDDFPNMRLDTTMINTATNLFDNRFKGSKELLLRHTDRICYGSDWPNVPYPYQYALDSLPRFSFSKEQAAAVFGANALAYLKLANVGEKMVPPAKP